MVLHEQLLGLFQSLAAYIAELFKRVMEYLAGALASVLTAIRDIIASLKDFFLGVFDAVVKKIVEIFETVKGALLTFLKNFTDFLAKLWEEVKAVTLGVLQAVKAFITDAAATFRAFVSTVIDTVRGWIESAIDFLSGVVDAALKAIGDTLDAVVTAAKGVIDPILDLVSEFIERIKQQALDAIQSVLGTADSLISSIQERLVGLKSAFLESATDIVASLAGLGEDIIPAINELLKPLIEKLVNWSNDPEMQPTMAELTNLFSEGGDPTRYRDFIHGLLSPSKIRSPFARGLVYIILYAAAAIPAGLNLATVYAGPMIQEVAKSFPYQLLSPADAVSSWRHGDISAEQAKDKLQRQGYSEADAQLILNTSNAVPTEYDALAMWLRELTTNEQLDEVLHQRGYSAAWRERYKQAAQLIPPVQDLITMAVREAFSPEVAARFGQFEDFPEAFAEWATKLGLSQQWAERYWAAHWSLPSPMQGFEMLHRGIISPDDLNLLLRALDVMPFWRDRLTQIAYNPFTRVDIRRMHALGVLDDAAVLRAHKDLGYDDGKAALLTEFVKRLNKRAPAEDDVELGRLSRSTILGFYADGLLSRERAHALLVGLGHTTEAAALYLENVDLEKERGERGDFITDILAMAEAGVITFDEAEDKLRGIGLETREVEQAVVRLIRVQQKRTKLPTRDDGVAFLRAGLITGAEYHDLLLRLGYSKKWADAYVALIAKEKSAG